MKKTKNNKKYKSNKKSKKLKIGGKNIRRIGIKFKYPSGTYIHNYPEFYINYKRKKM